MDNFFEIVAGFIIPLLLIVSAVANAANKRKQQEQRNAARNPASRPVQQPSSPWAELLGIPQASPTPVYRPQAAPPMNPIPAAQPQNPSQAYTGSLGNGPTMMTSNGPDLEGTSMESTLGSEGTSASAGEGSNEGNSTEGDPNRIRASYPHNTPASRMVRMQPAALLAESSRGFVGVEEGGAGSYAILLSEAPRVQRRNQGPLLSRKALIQGVIYSEILARPGGRRSSR